MSHDSKENPFPFFEFECDVLHANGTEEARELANVGWRRLVGSDGVVVEHPRTGAHPWVASTRSKTVRGILTTCTGRPAVVAVPAMANDAAGKEAARMENDEVGLLVALGRGARA